MLQFIKQNIHIGTYLRHVASGVNITKVNHIIPPPLPPLPEKSILHPQGGGEYFGGFLLPFPLFS